MFQNLFMCHTVHIDGENSVPAAPSAAGKSSAAAAAAVTKRSDFSLCVIV